MTSPLHTRRAGWLLRWAAGDGTEVLVAAGREPVDPWRWWASQRAAGREPVDPWRWWASQRSAGQVAIEWVKGVSSVRYLIKRPRVPVPKVAC